MSITESVKEYYGKVLADKNDLKTTACCSADSLPSYVKGVLGQVPDEIKSKFYGCGVPIPFALEGANVLDLGSGTGRDCYLLSSLVGPTGRVTGVDMTDEQLAVAEKYQDEMQRTFGYETSNVRFLKGYMEDLESLKIASGSMDLVVSNCVFNLSPEKERLYREIWRVLKPGGELYFSDVFADRRLPDACRTDPVVLGECLGGAQYIEDFRRMMFAVGCPDVRSMSRTEINVTDPDVKKKVGNARFYSITLRAFKVDLEDRCEDYGQVAYYRGGIPHSENDFRLDDHHWFEKDKPMLVCTNTANMLQQSRLAPYFEIQGDTSTHFGLFDCSEPGQPTSEAGPCC